MASQLPSSFHMPIHLASPLLSDPTASISSSSPTSISCLATLDSRNRNVPTSRLRFTPVPREMGTGSCVGSTKSSFQGAGVMRFKSECHSSLDKPAVLCQSARSTGFALPSCSSRLSSSVSPARASSGTKQKTQSTGDVDKRDDAKVVQVHTIKQFEDALTSAKSKLVVVEYAASHSANSRRIYPSMVELSRTCQDVVFLLVMGDESDETRQLCSQANIEKVPHFTFYKNKELIHEEEGIGPDELLGDVLYYGDTDAPILQLHSRQDVEDLLAKHVSDQKLVVLDVGLKQCGPCVKVYPTFVKLSKKMKDTTVFARINGDENEELMDLLKQMDVVEVPTFLFIRDGKLCGRYVGSGKGELIGEILKYQGVRVTY